MCFPVIIKPPKLKLRRKLTVLPKMRPGPDPCCVIACCSGVHGTGTSKRRGHSTKRCNRPSAPDSVVTREWLYSCVRISRFRCIVMPVHVNGNHWALLAADVAGRTVGLVDSLLSAANAAFVHLFQTYMAARATTTEEELADWTPMSHCA